MIKTVIGFMVLSLSSLAVPMTLESESVNSIDLLLDSQAHLVAMIPPNHSLLHASGYFITVTQKDMPINPTGGNGLGSFTGLGATPAGPAVIVASVPDNTFSGPLLLGSIVACLSMRAMMRRRSHPLRTLN